MESAEIARRYPSLLRRARARGGALGQPGRRGPHTAAGQRGHGALQALLPRAAEAGPPAGHERAEVHPYARHRRGRQDDPPRHVLPDAGQLLLRGLLQGAGDPLRLGAADPAGGRGRVRVPRGPPVGDRLPRRRRGLPDLARQGRPARGPHPAPRHGRQLLVHGRARTLRPLLGDLLRPRPGVRQARAARSSTRTATSRCGTSSSCSSSAAPVRARRTSRSSASCPPRTSTPAWAWSGWPRSSRASTTSTRSTPCGGSSTAPPT